MKKTDALKGMPSPAGQTISGPVTSGLEGKYVGTLANRIKILADPNRLRMLDLLATRSESLCVCDITSRFPLQQSTISHHLRLLREVGLVECEKHGVWAYYWATEESKHHLRAVKALL